MAGLESPDDVAASWTAARTEDGIPSSSWNSWMFRTPMTRGPATRMLSRSRNTSNFRAVLCSRAVHAPAPGDPPRSQTSNILVTGGASPTDWHSREDRLAVSIRSHPAQPPNPDMPVFQEQVGENSSRPPAMSSPWESFSATWSPDTRPIAPDQHMPPNGGARDL